MSTATTSNSTRRKPFPSLGLSPEKGDEIIGFVLLAVVALLAGSLLSYHPLDPSLLHQPAEDGAAIHNIIGPVGAELSALAFALLGLAALLLPLLLGLYAWRRLRHRSAEKVGGRGFGLAAVLVTLPALLHLTLEEIVWRGKPLDAGGVLGLAVADQLENLLNFGGAIVVLLTLLLVGGSLAAQSTLGEVAKTWRGRLAELWRHLELRRAQRRKRKAEAKQRRRVITRVERDAEKRRQKPPETATPTTAAEPDLPLRVTPKTGEAPFTVRKVKPKAEAEAEKPPEPAQTPLDFGPEEPPSNELPPVNLLRLERDARDVDESELVRLGELIRTSCAEFGVEGTIEGISPGPVITVFELQPAPGVKVSRIVGLQDDLALVLKAESVRIDRIPGRSTLGIEVPNKKRSVIHLGRLLTDEAFQGAPSPLTLALGVDIYGKPRFADLATMPHLLVAGATGAGKSVGLQSMITSIIYKATREEVQFIFIDPKRIELGVYANIPHLKTEVVVDPKKAANALRWAVAEMERRYRLLAEVHVRSIEYYNRAIRDPKERQRLSLKDGESEFQVEDLKPLPYYVIVIDELADLMMVAASDVETSIARLAQMARAVGLHLIIATQRPSVDVLTGTIKANFPCRLAFATATRHDSRTILDQVGSEKLLGKGDALFMPPGTSRTMRLHGAYISEQETAGLIRWLKRRGKPDLDLDVLKGPVEDRTTSDGAEADDDLFDEAARLVITERQASASFLQRRLRVGFSRAGRLIDMMEADGLVGPSQGSKARDILVPADYFEEIDRAHDTV